MYGVEIRTTLWANIPNMDHYSLRQRVIDMQREPSEVATGRAEEDVTNTSRENREDIFLFVPNLIGSWWLWKNHNKFNYTDTHLRICSDHPHSRLALLHACSPPTLQRYLCSLMSPWCTWRLGSSEVQPRYQVRRCTGYGDRSLYDYMSTCLSGYSHAEMGYVVSTSDQSRSG